MNITHTRPCKVLANWTPAALGQPPLKSIEKVAKFSISFRISCQEGQKIEFSKIIIIGVEAEVHKLNNHTHSQGRANQMRGHLPSPSHSERNHELYLGGILTNN